MNSELNGGGFYLSRGGGIYLSAIDKPFDQTSIKDIAQAAGVNRGLLHYYFKSKEDILIHYSAGFRK